MPIYAAEATAAAVFKNTKLTAVDNMIVARNVYHFFKYIKY